MYRIFILILVLFTLTACGNSDVTTSKHDASLGKALTEKTVVAQPAIKCPVSGQECITDSEKCPVLSNNQQAGSAPGCPTLDQDRVPTDKVTRADDENAPVVTVDAAPVTSSAFTTSILTLQLENEFGAVFVPHRLHVELFSCDTCHATTPPAKIEKNKKEFHALCRKCHTEMQAGPTKCRECHQRN